MGQILDRAIAAIGNYGNPQGQSDYLAKQFNDATQGMGALDKQKTWDIANEQMSQTYDKDVLSSVYQKVMPVVDAPFFSLSQGSDANDAVVAGVNAAAGGIKAISDFVGGNGNAVSSAIGGFIDAGEATKSEESRLNNYLARQKIQQAYATDGYGDDIKAHISALAANPTETVAQVFGSVIGGGGGVGLAARGLGVGARLATGIAATTEAVAGAGYVKGQQYAATYADAINQGYSEPDARALANHASELNQQQVLGGVIGGIAGHSGIEAALLKSGSASVLRSALDGSIKEGFTEAVQGGQQQYAGNAASIDTGVRDPSRLYEGVVGSAVAEGLLGGLAGGAFGGVAGLGQSNAPQSAIDAALNPQGMASTVVDNAPIQQIVETAAQPKLEFSPVDNFNVDAIVSPNVEQAIDRLAKIQPVDPLTKGTSNEVSQILQEAAAQAPLTAQQRIERAAANYSPTASNFEVAGAYSPRIDAQPEYQSLAAFTAPAFNYDGEVEKIDKEIANIAAPVANIAGRLRQLGGVDLKERSDLLGETGGVAARSYPALFGRQSKSLHDHLNDGLLNDMLPAELQIHPTDGIPTDTQPAFDYIADKLRMGDTSVDMDFESQLKIEQLSRIRDDIVEARNSDTQYVNQQFSDNALAQNNDYAALQSARPTPIVRDNIKTGSAWSIEAATERLAQAKQMPLSKKQQNLLRIVTPKYLNELKDIERIFSKWKEKYGRTTARGDDNTIVRGFDRSRPKQSDNGEYVDSRGGENQPAAGNADSGSAGRGAELGLDVGDVKFSQQSKTDNGVDRSVKTNLLSQKQPAPDAGFSSPKTGNTVELIKDSLSKMLSIDVTKSLPNVSILQAATPEIVSKLENGQLSVIGKVGAKALDDYQEATTRIDNLEIAKQMRLAGKDARNVKLATGWEYQPDGWRYEVSNDTLTSKAYMRQQIENGFVKLPVSKFVGIDVSAAYPTLDHVMVSIYIDNDLDNKGRLKSTKYGDETVPEEISVTAKTVDDAYSILLHEVQHAIQNYEGFNNGNNNQPERLAEDKKRYLQRQYDAEIKRIEPIVLDLKSKRKNGEISNDDFIKKYESINETALDLFESLNINEISWKRYKKDSGEAEARNVQSRIGMTDEQRRASLLDDTSDVSPEDRLYFSRILDGSKQQNDSIQGAYDGKTGRVYLFADNIKHGEENAVLLHEIFHKRGRELLGRYMPELVKRVTVWKDKDASTVENQIYVAADARAQSSGDYDGEFLAYAIEEAIKRGVELKPQAAGNDTAAGFLSHVWRMFTLAFKKLVPNYKGKFTADDLVIIAYGAAGLELNENDNAIQKQRTSESKEVTSQSQKDQDAEIVAQYANESGAPTEAEVRAAQQQIRDIEAKYAKELANGSWRNLTPTGKPSELIKRQWVEVRTDNFKRWFGDWENDAANASKVVNKTTGEPQVLFHGTNYNAYDDDKITEFNTQPRSSTGAAYFSSDKNIASQYGEGIYEVFVNSKNPLIISGSGNHWSVLPNNSEINGVVTKSLVEKSKRDADELTKTVNEMSDLFDDDGIRVEFSPKITEEITELKGMVLSDLGVFGDSRYETDQVSKAARKLGFTGVIFRDIKDSPVIGAYRYIDSDIHAAFRPNQIKSATANVGTFDSGSNDIRFSKRSTLDDVTDFSKSGKTPDEKSIVGAMLGRDKAQFMSKWNEFADTALEWFADNLLPAKRWIDDMPIREQERERLSGDMYRATGVRDSLNEEMTHKFIKPLWQELAVLKKKYKKYSESDLKKILGYWMSVKYAPTANANLIAKDRDAYNEAVAGGDVSKIANAKADLDERIKEVGDVELGRNKFDRGVAGGYTDAKANQVRKNLEALISVADLESASKHIYAMLDYKLGVDVKSGKISQDMHDEFKLNKNYVPLTGDPQSDIDDTSDAINGGSGVNTQKDKAIGGRKGSVAEDAIDAAWRAVSKSTSFAGWSTFKNSVNSTYENALNGYITEGMTMERAQREVAREYGLKRSALSGMTRTNDDVLIHRVNGKDVQFEMPKNVIGALQNNNKEQMNALLNVIAKPTRLYARAVTQFYPVFAPINAVRDLWEKSEVIRHVHVFDVQGKAVDTDAVAKSMVAKMASSQWSVAFKAAFKGDFSSDVGKDLKELMELGGLSTQGTMLAGKESDLIAQMKDYSTWSGQTKRAIIDFVSAYNETFDFMPSLAAYRSLKEAGVSPKEAAAATLDLTNFRKTGSKMALPKALFMFSQPVVTGAVNLGRTLKTNKGRMRFAAYVAIGIMVYSALRALDDEDEGGNKLDEMGDISRYIPIPLSNGKYLKIPVGFGMPQLAWNMATNVSRAAYGDIGKVDALSNIVAHMAKTVSPVSPSEIPIAKYPLQKLALTATPTLLQPLVQNALNRNAFGTQITTGFINQNKLKSEQSKSTTAEFWKDTALTLQRDFGVDMHPEQIKNLVDGYGAGIIRDGITIAVENPNRERLGRDEKTPFINSLYGAGNEFAIQSRYYEAVDEARKLKAELDSRKKQGDIGDWLTDDVRKSIAWLDMAASDEAKASAVKSKATRLNGKGGMSDSVYEAVLNGVAKSRVDAQKKNLNLWRKIKELPTTRTQ